MKKITLLLTFMLASVMGSYGQASSYGFSTSTGTYTETSAGATALPLVRADTYISPAQNIGFNFVYEGVTYTQFKMSSNGFISFNMTGTTSLTTNNFSTANATSRPVIAPLWDDLDGAGPASSVAAYEVTGIAPNQVLTVEWRNWEWNYGSTTPVISFQVKLYETTNVIEFVYRQEATAVASGSASIGIGSATGSGAGSFLNVTSIATPAVSNSAAVTNLNTKPATDQIYTFSPPLPCTGTPIGGTVAPTNLSICSGSLPGNITASGFSGGVTGLTFQWEQSTDAGANYIDAVGGTNATTAVYTPSAYAGAPIQYRLRVTCTNSGLFDYSTVCAITNATTPTTQVTTLAANPTLTTAPLSWVSGNGGRRVVYFNDSATFVDPIDGNAPALTATAAYAGSGQQIVYDGTGTTMTVTGLTASTTYYVKVYEYLRCGAGPYDYFYNVTTGTNILTVTTLSPPANNDFANASVISCGNIYTGSTAFATLDEDTAPDGFGTDMDAPNVWFTFTGSGTAQTVTLDLCASTYDSSVLVYTGTSGSLVLIAANDDDSSCGTRSKVNFNSDGTTTYRIAIEGYNVGSVGPYSMTVSCVAVIPPAVTNQDCGTSLSTNVNGVDLISDNSYGTASAAQPTCDLFGTIQDVWFSFVAPASGTVDCLVTNGTMTSANFVVYSGACGSLVEVAASCNSNITTSATEAMTGLVGGNTYYVQVWSNSTEQGTFTLRLTDATLATESFDNAGFSYYPNPVKNMLNLSYTENISDVAVYNLLGQQVIAKVINANQSQIDMSHLTSGAYMIKVTANNQIKMIKVIKE